MGRPSNYSKYINDEVEVIFANGDFLIFEQAKTTTEEFIDKNLEFIKQQNKNNLPYAVLGELPWGNLPIKIIDYGKDEKFLEKYYKNAHVFDMRN